MIISTIIFALTGMAFVSVGAFVAMMGIEPGENPLPGLGRVLLVALAGVIAEVLLARSLPVELGAGLIAIATFAVGVAIAVLLVQPITILMERIPFLRRRAEARMTRQGYTPDGHGGWVRFSGPPR